jgi:hypothetical protein
MFDSTRLRSIRSVAGQVHSPQQRLQLVSEVMVGLLCPVEPLPPETIQHFTTYLTLVSILRIELEN